MKYIFENWRGFITEDNGGTYPFRIFCDMDGVLVDLVQGIIDKIHLKVDDERQKKAMMDVLSSGKPWKDFKTSAQGKEVLKLIYKTLGNDADFWASLPQMPEAQKLWDFISVYDPIILSAPWDKDSAKGKEMWTSNLADNLRPTPSRVILTQDKYKYALNKETGSPNVLIDDMDKFLRPWEEAGGIAIKHTSANSTIRQIKELMDKDEESEESEE